MAAAASKRKRNARRWFGLLTAVLVMTVPSLVVMTVTAAPARAWDIEDCTSGVDCPGDPGGGTVGLDNGDCLWDSCGDGSQSGDPDPSDQCTDSSCQDGQNPPEQQCIIIIKPDGTLVCIDNQPGDPPPPPPPDCSDTGTCPDPITEDPINPDTCAPADDGTQFLFNQDNFVNDTLTADPFPDMDPSYNDMCPPPPVPPAPPNQFGATDVAFGDSYISGEGRGPFVAAPGGTTCDVANDAWPNLAYGTGGAVGAVFGAPSTHPFENWACTGATIADTTNEINAAMQAGQTDSNATGQQFAGLGVSTARVQISAGGNDLGFGPDLNCAYTIMHRSDNVHAMRDKTHTCIPNPADPAFQNQVSALIPLLFNLYRLPMMNGTNGASGPIVEAISYPMMFPQANTPACGNSQTGITRADQVWINDDTLLLDNAIRQAAANAGVPYFDFSTALQNGATICDNPRGVNEVSDVITHTNGAFHPNALGHQRLLAAYMRQNFFSLAGVTTATPANGTLVGDRSGDGIYVAAGGALFPFPNQTNLFNSAYKGQNITLEPSNQIAAQVGATPADGTLLKDASTGAIFAVSGGKLVPFAPTQVVLPATTVPDASLAGYPITSGTFMTVAGGDGTVYESVGGAPVPVTNWSHVGGAQPTGIISQAQFAGMPQIPADGTFVAATNPATGAVTNYEFAGGAPIVVTNWSHVGGQPATAPIAIDQTAIDNAGGSGTFSHIRQTPADGTFVTATDPNTGAVNAYVFAGGAPIYISDPSHVGGVPAGSPAIDQTAIDNAGTGGVFNHVLPIPADGTYLTGQGAGGAVVSSYVVAGGAPLPITDWTHLGGSDPGTPPASISPIPVDETAIDNAGTGGVYSHLRAMPPDGTYLTARGAGGAVVSSYVVAGSAPLPITNWTHLGGPNPTTPPSGINPVTVDENAMDNAGTGGIFNHLRAMPPDGTILAGNADKTNGIFVMAGGAPIYVSNWEDIGGARGSVNVDQTAIDDAGSGGIFNHLRAQPANGTLVQSFGTGHIFVIAGGAPLEVSSLANIGSPTQTPTFVDQVALNRAGTGGFYNHLNFTPANNTLLAGNGTNSFVVAGGAPVYVPYLEDIGGARGFVTVDQAAIDNAGSGGDWNHLSFTPADGTIFESFNTGSVYQVIGGVPTLDCAAAQTFLYVDQFALNQAGTGGFYNHLLPLPSPPPPPCPPPPPSGPGPQL